MTPFTVVTSKVVVLPFDDVDTDQIIPARHLKITTREGLGEHVFEGWRFDDKGALRPDFPMNRPEAKGAQILVAGANFGCGSSREHAPWALSAWGFRVVLARSFGDIFRNNALKNGLLPVTLDAEMHRRLVERKDETPAPTVTVDLVSQTVRLDDGTVATFTLDPFSKHCLLEGVDELGYLLSQSEKISAYEASHG